MQALSRAIKLYQSAADEAGSQSADEAGTAALRLANMCDSLLKVKVCCLCSLSVQVSPAKVDVRFVSVRAAPCIQAHNLPVHRDPPTKLVHNGAVVGSCAAMRCSKSSEEWPLTTLIAS